MQNYWRVLLPIRSTRIGGGGGGSGIRTNRKDPKINPSNPQVLQPGQLGPCYRQKDADNGALGPKEF